MFTDEEIDIVGFALEEKGLSHSQIDEHFLEHYGVPGMKWGVRRQRRMDNLRRASGGVGGLATKARAFSNLGPIDLVKGRGIKGGAERKADRVEDRADRIRKGEATVNEKLRHYGTMNAIDLVPVRTSQVGKKSSAERDKALVAAWAAVQVASLLSKSASAK